MMMVLFLLLFPPFFFLFFFASFQKIEVADEHRTSIESRDKRD